jgi:hypothetical protein
MRVKAFALPQRAQRLRNTTPAELLRMSFFGQTPPPEVHELTNQPLLREVHGGIQVFTFFADVEFAMTGQLDQDVAPEARVALAHPELKLHPVEIVGIGVCLDGPDDVLHGVLSDRIGEIEMTRR